MPRALPRSVVSAAAAAVLLATSAVVAAHACVPAKKGADARAKSSDDDASGAARDADDPSARIELQAKAYKEKCPGFGKKEYKCEASAELRAVPLSVLGAFLGSHYQKVQEFEEHAGNFMEEAIEAILAKSVNGGAGRSFLDGDTATLTFKGDKPDIQRDVSGWVAVNVQCEGMEWQSEESFDTLGGAMRAFSEAHGEALLHAVVEFRARNATEFSFTELVQYCSFEKAFVHVK